MLDFDKIRQQLKAVVTEHGGKIEINEWNASDGETMKVVMTFKALADKASALRSVAGYTR